MKTLTLIVLLFTSQFVEAETLTKSEKECLAKSVYAEGRSLSKKERLLIANVALNRKKLFKKWNFGAKSSHLCDIVQSKEYHSNIKKKVKEEKIYAQISQELQALNWQNLTAAQYFTTRNNKLLLQTKRFN